MAQAVSSNLAASNVSDHIIWRKWILRCFAVTLCILFWNITVYNSNEETTDDFDKKVQIIDTQPASVDIDNYMTEEQINLKYCGSPVCQFMLPIYVAEQESRARLHVRSLTILAQETGRVLVLPNVENALIGTCQTYSFDYYYSIEAMRQSSPNITFITQSQFLSWNQEMKAIKARIPTVEVVKLNNTHRNGQDRIVSEQINLEAYKQYNCLEPFDYLSYKDIQETDITVFSLIARKPTEEQVVTAVAVAQFVINSLRLIQSDVIFMHYNFYRFTCLQVQHLPAPLQYADHLIERAKTVSTFLHPYIGIHWRMETANPEKLVNCSIQLIEYIQRIKEEKGIRNIYFATDYPIDGGDTHSGTFLELTKDHHRAAKMLANNLDFYTWQRLNASLFPFKNDKFVAIGKKPVNKEGLGVLAIWDKLVLMHANWFVSGPPGCCRITSSYTAQVVKARGVFVEDQEISSGEPPKDALLNLWDTW
ncbi:8785_t:CDS:2 [Paraglomus brasilianum]|uniref:8785_t:CDS:1 n=1 Tax=Paraglomus brasilianum TaxID=144538 RepID=A0A9N9ARX8_9GLOM|nr:8785_t:CDS:2 [Paraglomus brasilianum]